MCGAVKAGESVTNAVMGKQVLKCAFERPWQKDPGIHLVEQ